MDESWVYGLVGSRVLRLQILRDKKGGWVWLKVITMCVCDNGARWTV